MHTERIQTWFSWEPVIAKIEENPKKQPDQQHVEFDRSMKKKKSKQNSAHLTARTQERDETIHEISNALSQSAER